jgi:hypothetical protein
MKFLIPPPTKHSLISSSSRRRGSSILNLDSRIYGNDKRKRLIGFSILSITSTKATKNTARSVFDYNSLLNGENYFFSLEILFEEFLTAGIGVVPLHEYLYLYVVDVYL